MVKSMTLNMPYEEIVEKIVAESNLSKEEVIKMINDKVDELGGLITHDGAAHIIARDLEINLYESQQLQKPKPTQISDFIDGMNNVTITALIKNIYEPTVFTRNNDGSQGAVQNIDLADKSGICRLVLWDDQIRQFNDMGLSRGDLVRIIGVYVKENPYERIKDINLSSRSQIDINPEDVDKKNFPDSLLAFKKIKDIVPEMYGVDIICKITAIRPPSHFKRSDGSEGTVSTMEIADETGKIKITFWDQKAELVTQYKADDVIEIIGGKAKSGRTGTEVHMGKNAMIKKNTKTKIKIPPKILEAESLISSTAPKKSDEPSEEVRLADLKEGMSNISIIARVTGKTDISEFQRESDNSTGRVGTLWIKDISGPSKVTLWNSHTEYIKKVDIGDIIRVEGAYVKIGRDGPEVHVSRSATIDINPEHFKDLLPELQLEYKELGSLQAGLKDISVKAVVTLVQELRTFTRQSDGSEGQVLNIGLRDNTGSVRLVAWNEKAIELETMEEMTPIEILHGFTKEGRQGVELHVGKLTTIRKIKKKDIGDLKDIKADSPKKETTRVDIVDLEENQFSEIKGTIVKVNESKMYYLACPECRKKVTETEDGLWICSNPEHGNVEPEQAIFISVVLDDGTACIKVTFFREQAEQLIRMSSANLVDQINNTDIQSVVLKLQKDLEGREILVKGRPKRSSFDQELEINAFSFADIDPKSEIKIVKDALKV
jgi:replication factor A1